MNRIECTSLRVRVAWVAAVAWLLAVGPVRSAPSAAADPVWREYRAEVREVGDVLIERGHLRSRNSVVVRNRMPGTITFVVETGTPVREGDVLFEIDDFRIQDEIEEHQDELTRLQIRLEKQRKRLEIVERQEAARLEIERKRLAHARLELEVESEALTAEERRLLEIERALADLDLEDAREEFEYQQRLYDKGFVSDVMLEPYRRRFETAQAFVEELKVKRQLREKGIPAERRVELERNVTRARAAVERGERAMARRLQEIRDEIGIVEIQIREREYQIASREGLLEDSVVRAPSDGIARRRQYVDWRQGGAWSEYRPGVRVWPYDSLVDLVNLEEMEVSLMINEVDFNRLAPGVKTRVRMPAFPEKIFEGHLESLGGIGRDRFELALFGEERRETDVTVFNATVVFDNPGVRFRPGMSAFVEFVLDEPRRRLVVPRAAVDETEEGPVVWRRDGDRVEPRPVEGEAVSDDYFAIDSGLAEGDVILLDVTG